MDWITKMNESLEYIEENLEEGPDIVAAGRIAGCSAYHFQRVFSYMAGITLGEYLRRRRLSKAAVDLHFSASANQTNETMRFLAILTAIFAPLTLLTGVYGMNFDVIPGLHNPRGFWFLLVGMVVVTVSLLYYFYRNRIVNRSEKSIAQLLSGEMDA